VLAHGCRELAAGHGDAGQAQRVAYRLDERLERLLWSGHGVDPRADARDVRERLIARAA